MKFLINKSYIVFLLLMSCSTVSFAASKSDINKELRWEEQIVPSLMVGEGIKLNADGQQFLALYAQATTKTAKGAIILLHGRGVHPAWPDVIEPLRTELPDLGWHTLSLQMPVLSGQVDDKDYPPLFAEVPFRIQAGVNFLKSKGIKSIVIAGHSLGNVMASYYLTTNKDPVVKMFAILSVASGVPNNPKMDSFEHFKAIKNVSILDVHGSNDTQDVQKAIKQRKHIGNKVHGMRYHSLKIEGANHFYKGKKDVLLTELERWMSINIPH